MSVTVSDISQIINSRNRDASDVGRPRLTHPPDRCQPARRRFADDTAQTPTINRLPDPAGPDLEAVWDQEWEKHLLQVATERVKQQVNAEQYQIFGLQVLQGWSAREVARILGVGLGRVYLTKHRLAKLLRQEIARANGRNPQGASSALGCIACGLGGGTPFRRARKSAKSLKTAT